MAKQYYIELSRNEIATVSYFPGFELREKPESEWVEDVLVPALLPVIRRKNKKISQVPITFWACIRETARPFSGEIFLFQTPAFSGLTIENAIEEALRRIEKGMVLVGKENIQDYAVPVCQLFRNKLIRFYFGKKELEAHFMPAFKWEGKSLRFTQSYLEHSAILLENLDSEILFMRAEVSNSTLMNGGYYRKFQQALNCIGIES